ncbi:MAG: DUF2637 domain-containing protein [Propionicimonas sp.]
MTTTTAVPARPLTIAPGLSARAESAIRRTSTFTVVVLAAAAAVLSYAGLTQLAVEAQIHPRLTFLLPVVVDGLTLVGGMTVLHSTLTGLRSWYGWLLTLLGVAASVVGNIAASPVDPLSRAVHAAPPIVLALALEALLRVYRHRVTHSHHVEPGTVEAVIMSPAATSAITTAVQAAVTTALTAASTATALAIGPEAPVLPEPVPEVAPEPAPEVAPEPVAISPTRPVGAPSPVSEPSTENFNVTQLGVAEDAPLKERVAAMLATYPTMSGGQIARHLGADKSYTNKTIRDLRAEQTTTIPVKVAPQPPPTPVVIPAPALVAPVAVPVAPTPAPAAAPPVALPTMDEPMFSGELFDDELALAVRDRQPEPV